MEIVLKNPSGRIRKVETGNSVTALFFGGFVFLFRGLFKQFFLWLGFCVIYLIVLHFIFLLITNYDVELFIKGIGSLAINVFLMIKMNDISVRAYLKQGYVRAEDPVKNNKYVVGELGDYPGTKPDKSAIV